MRLIFIYGMPATGKLTVARELGVITDYPLFHNHLAVDLLLSMFEFGSEPFVELREQIWLSVFEQAAKNNLPGLIFTFAPEATVRPSFIPAAQKRLAGSGGQVDFVRLTCPVAEVRRRVAEPSRLQYKKLASVPLFDQILAEGGFESLPMPQPRITVDTSTCTPARAALEIARALELSGFSTQGKSE
jgi:hypothetical protein